MQLSVIGTGKMGSAIIKGLLEKNVVPASAITGTDNHPDAQHSFLALDQQRALKWANTPATAVKHANVILIAVKPQNMTELLPKLTIAPPEALIISIAAGITLARLETELGDHRPIFRAMPNTPLMVGEGVTAYAANKNITEKHHEIFQKIFGATGKVFPTLESQLDAVTALSGSGPAYMAYIIDALSKAAQEQGLDEKAALAMALQTMRGSATLLQQSGMTPAELIIQVASKGGTTEAGLNILKNSDLSQVLTHTVQAAAQRSRELAKV